MNLAMQASKHKKLCNVWFVKDANFLAHRKSKEDADNEMSRIPLIPPCTINKDGDIKEISLETTFQFN